ncbi:unnamed protein product [Linum tenue]|uniref:NAD(P)-binding domain-containing protein n=1 Tax=Linum tenue TaxID=586396 RepID=A0AAV0Q7C9_9ROSI|nr:unnamed protein product [Linum tenue]
MATKISFTPTHNFPPRLGNFAKYPQTIPLYPLQPLNVSHRNCNLKAGSGSAAAAKVQALKEDLIESLNSDASADSATASFPSSSKLVLVVGGSGGVGQLVVASLLTRGIKSRLFLRDPEKATALFGVQDNEKLEVLKADTRNSADLDPSMFEGVTHVICTTGTTAFPSRRWDGDNTPERVDWEGVRNLVSALPPSVKRLVLVSSVGVTKFNELPWSIMNLFGVLKYKKMGEDFVRKSGLPFTIIRPGRLTDGPYTSYDLNTLLKATAGERRAVIIGQGDKLVGEASRLVVAEACIQALDIDFTEGNAYEISSVVRLVLCREKVQEVIHRNGGICSKLPKTSEFYSSADMTCVYRY